MPRLVLLALVLACARPDHIEIDPRAPRLSRKGESVHLHAKLMDRAGPLEVDLVEALQIDPGTLELAQSAEPVKIKVVALGLDGHPLRDRKVHLVPADPRVARVDPEGRVWPVAPGDAVVRANIDDKEGEVAVHVRAH